jgi:uncharacterized protein YqfB (UPF0267 family)
MRLGFKAEFIEPILVGHKTDTIRRSTTLQPGDYVNAGCRYDKPPFAVLRVLSVSRVTYADMDRERAMGVAAMYPGAKEFAQITFEVVKAKKKRPRAWLSTSSVN